VLPPSLRGTSRPAYPLHPDPSLARRLMHGRRVQVAYAANADEAGTLFEPQFARTLRTELAAIGIDLRVVPLRQTLNPAQRAAVLRGADLAQVGGNADNARDPVSYLLGLPYLRASDRARLMRIDELPSPRREAAAASLAAQLERDAVYIGLADAATAELVSPRLGCKIDQPEYPGLDLAALCTTPG